MYLNALSEFSDFLANKDHTLQEILDHLVRVTLSPLKATSIIYFQSNDTNEFYISGESGVSVSAESELVRVYSMDDNYPAATSIGQGKFLWLPHTPESIKQFPVLEYFPHLIGSKTLILSPVMASSTPVASMAIFCSKEIKYEVKIESFISALCSIFSLYYYRIVASTPIQPKDRNRNSVKTSVRESAELTSRQGVILRLIAEDRTNSSISEFLGYSESTIRQEIMRIFAKLGCSSRHEASEIYISWNKD